MSHEAKRDAGGPIQGGVSVVKRPAVSTVTTMAAVEGVQYPKPYFDSEIDWQVGAKNPFREAIKRRRQEMEKNPTFFQACSGIV